MLFTENLENAKNKIKITDTKFFFENKTSYVLDI